ncbi:MAG: Inositol 2-dehydrogenase/D-chiro-inositol 3-dehydrogenase [Chlamydiia bacterium]|nr:Inositol 2-dehydrogenase/D-chiro-inositol 3-dehydrogenase [Chlamydiia bacterium]MCH9616416.1 Inositol 2-dehydrogenase/D-chiro-inositol 3-dehydrogenase [Chlamydiia bacterium]MCH9629598.1 Inositol 2-dehydrogenase/D-chiro-inositol 3-dehydrogenase [Chlamydiia bacterium]
MRVVVIGLGIQGKKRRAIAGDECIAVVDPIASDVDYQDIKEVPLNDYDAALVCTPDNCKVEILTYLLENGKHVLVEKPLLGTHEQLSHLEYLAIENQVCCYTAYNHRFEPHFVRMRELIGSGSLGEIYHCRMFYGNGTARDVRNSPWRDQGGGVLGDLGSHLLDTIHDWFGIQNYDFNVVKSHTFENNSPDHVHIATNAPISIDLEMTLLSFRNHFTCDIFAEKGTAHISSLCKWGPSTFTVRDRKLPSGRPDEQSITLVESDPTWQAEYSAFKERCEKASSNISHDIILATYLSHLLPQATGALV